MSCVVSAVPAISQDSVATKVVKRQSANFQPSIWGDYFLKYASPDDVPMVKEQEKMEMLEVELRKMFGVAVDKIALLELIDQVQRLGIAYKFETEIEFRLQQIYKCFLDYHDYENEDLCIVSLQFRLLRQQGYNISCDIFNKFTNEKGKFDESLATDVKGLLNLYEASHFRVHGEYILDEAWSFTKTHLKSIDKKEIGSHLKKQVKHALIQSLRCGLTRLEARHYMSIYEEDPSHNEVILSLAKLDFNFLQKQHQKELSHITRWWKDLDFTRKLPFARDRIVECYFWILGVYFEPKYAMAREILTKVIYMTSIIDDIYDIYGTNEELELFAHAVESWDIEFMSNLPEYMQLCYKALLDVYDEIGQKLVEQGISYRLYYAKEAMKDQVRAYYLEAKWIHHIPTMEEYMPIALVTTGYALLAVTSFVGMGDIVTKDVFEWLRKNPKILKASTVICRLMDDIVSRKREREIQHIPSAVECYMKQYDVTEETAKKEFRKQIADAWKDINEESLSPNAMPMPILIRIINLACTMDVLYKDEETYTYPERMLTGFVTSLLVEPV